MKRLFVSLALSFAALSAMAQSPAIHDIDIRVSLDKDGTALIEENWDVCVASGTEWYLNRENLGDIEVSGLVVEDEKGITFEDVGEWNVKWNLERKEGKSGIVHKSNGVELCWGVGSYGDHRYKVSYRMSNAVKSLNDCDLLHMQFISPGLSSTPEHARVRIEVPGVAIDTTFARAWGFGFRGNLSFEDDAIVLESYGRIESVIALVRFEKGYFNSRSIQDRDFDDVKSRAFESSDYEEEEEPIGLIIGMFASFIAVAIALVFGGIRSTRRKILGGILPKEVPWYREVPFDGDLKKSIYTLERLSMGSVGGEYASASILQLINGGWLSISKDSRERVEIRFTDKSTDSLDEVTARLISMMRAAAGANQILERDEFSNWAEKNNKKVNRWAKDVHNAAEADMKASELVEKRGRAYTREGSMKAQELIGLRNFLKEFVQTRDKDVIEVHLWKDYLVFGTLFGMADKVAKQLNQLGPEIFAEEVGYDYMTMHTILHTTRNLGYAITNAQISANAVQGKGGATSFGGGGGFSGGGFGGGSR